MTATDMDCVPLRTDEELVCLLRSERDPETAELLCRELFGRQYTRVTAWCVGFAHDAADLTQEVLFKAYRSLDAYRGDSKFSTWLYTITRNHCLTAARKRAAEPAAHASELSQELADRRCDPYEEFEREQDRERLWSLVRTCLSDTEARILKMHYCDEIPLDAVSRLLGLSNQSGAKAYVVSARRKLAARRRRAQSAARCASQEQ